MTCTKRRLLQRIIAVAILLMLPLNLSGGLADAGAPAGITQAKERSQTVRVYLSRIGITDRMDLTLDGPYALHIGDETVMRFTQGSELAVLLKGGSLYVYYQGMSVNAGQEISLTRYAGTGEGKNGFRLTNYPALYMGDLRLSVVEEKIRPILSIHVEDYLLGVVPYEMSNGFPLEALKAQAVAARTYALRKQNPKNEYDVVDTTNDQVFKGYQPGSEQVEQAVRETRGVCGFYKGELAQCYYSASNGGQMERVATVWPTDEDFGYYVFGQDEYDVENPASVVRSFVIEKKYAEGNNAPYALRKLLAQELAQELVKRGYDPAAESVRVDEVSALGVDTPKGDEGSRLMTTFRFSVKISGRTRTDRAVASVEDMDTEEVSLFAVEETPRASATPSPFSEPGATITPTPSPSPTPEPIYGKFTPIEESFALELPIFPTVEKALSMDISGNYDNEIWSVVETDSAYTIEARRYGHGIGMSQRGAQWMAGRYAKSFQEILKFYYPGLELMQYPENDIALPAEEAELAATAGPAPSPTPRPTLMPAPMEAAGGQWYALVTGIDNDSSLNLRATPELNGEIVMRLYKNQRLLVLERCQEEGWVKVKTDVAEGYVVEKYLTTED